MTGKNCLLIIKKKELLELIKGIENVPEWTKKVKNDN